MPNWKLEQSNDGGCYSRINLITPKGHYLSLNYVMNEVNDENGEWVRDEYSDEHRETYAELERMVEVMNREVPNA